MMSAMVSGPISLKCFLTTMPTPVAISITPSHASVRSSSPIGTTLRRAAMSIRQGYASHSNDIRDRESDLRGHHHQIHMPPRRMVLGGRELIGIADDQPQRVRAPDREKYA